jgi:hypothetical protein
MCSLRHNLFTSRSPILYNIHFVLKGAAPVTLFITTCVLALVTGSAFAISIGLSTFCQFAMKSLKDLGILQANAYVFVVSTYIILSICTKIH